MVRQDRAALSCWLPCLLALVLSTQLCLVETETVTHVKKGNHRIATHHNEDYGKQAALEDFGSDDFDDMGKENDGLPDVGVLEAEIETKQMHNKRVHLMQEHRREKKHYKSRHARHHKEDEFGVLASGTGEDLSGLQSKLAELDLREVNVRHRRVHKNGASRKNRKRGQADSDTLDLDDGADLDEGNDDAAPRDGDSDDDGSDSDDFLPPSLRGNIASMTELPKAHKKRLERRGDIDDDDEDDFSLPSADGMDLDDDNTSDSNSARSDASEDGESNDSNDSAKNSASVSDEQILEELGGDRSRGLGKDASRSESSSADDAFNVNSFIPSLAEHDLDDSMADPTKPVKKRSSRVDLLQNFVDVSLNELRPDGTPRVHRKAQAVKATPELPFMSMNEIPANGEDMAAPPSRAKGAMPMTDAQFVMELDELASGSSGHEHTLSLEDAEGVLAEETPKAKEPPTAGQVIPAVAGKQQFALPDDSTVYSNMLRNPLDGSTVEMEEQEPAVNGGQALPQKSTVMTPDVKADKLLNAAMDILKSSPITSVASQKPSPLAAAASAIAQEQQIAAMPIVQQNPNMSLNELFAKVMTSQIQGTAGAGQVLGGEPPLAAPAQVTFQPNLKQVPVQVNPAPVFSASMPAVMLHGEVVPTSAADNSQLQAAAAMAEGSRLTLPRDAPPALKHGATMGAREPVKSLKPFPSHHKHHDNYERRDSDGDGDDGEDERRDTGTDLHHGRDEVRLDERRSRRRGGHRSRRGGHGEKTRRTRSHTRAGSRAKHEHRGKQHNDNDDVEARNNRDEDDDDDDDAQEERAGSGHGRTRGSKHRHAKHRTSHSRHAKSQKENKAVHGKGSVSDMIEKLRESMGSDDDGDETNGANDSANAAEDAALVKFKDLGVSLE